MNSAKKFYVTTPIYYVTAKPHLGSLYSTLLADVLARWHKLQGYDVFFQTGTDEHGQKVAEAAAKAGMTPQAFVDSFIPAYKETWREYNLDYNNFIRTTDPVHARVVQEWILALMKKGDIYKGTYKGWYCVSCETFVAEKGEDETGPLCPDCGRATTLTEEESYFFRLSAYQDKLLKFYAEHPDFFLPHERGNEVISFVKSGLKDLSLSRTSITWGIPFPGDPKHCVYVWADALNNYLTGVGYLQPGRETEFKKWWPANVHIMAKEIVRFHAVHWPAFLMATGLPLPEHLLVHGWLLVDNKKMSKSLGNVVDPHELATAYGVDPVRYYLVRHLATNQDANFSVQELEQRVSSDLANDLGNLLNRMTALAEKNAITTLVTPATWYKDAAALRDASHAMVAEFCTIMEKEIAFHKALAVLWKYINQVNAFFQTREPWKQAKNDHAAFLETLSATVHSLETIATLLLPVMPEKMAVLLASIGVQLVQGDMITPLKNAPWNKTYTMTKIEPLFEKPLEREVTVDTKNIKSGMSANVEPTNVEFKKVPGNDGAKIDTQTSSVAGDAQVPSIPEISIDDFIKVHCVVGTIEQAVEVDGSDKLLKLTVNLGSYGIRTILSGVKKFFAPTDLVGKQGVFVANLKPRKMMGQESHGMMLFVESSDGSLKAVTVDGVVDNGARLR